MVFTSNVFMFLFLPILLIFYFGVFRNNIKMKNLVLCVSSLLFYAWGEPIVVFLMIISIIVNYFFGLCMTSKNKKAFLVLSVIYNLSFLFVFKYFNFTSDLLGGIFGMNFIKINIGLPIGISFYTFQIMSYVIDVYRREAKPQKNIINLALYISLFPQLIAGPIVRYNNISVKEIQKVYSGEITQWEEFAVQGFGNVKTFQRDKGSKSQKALENY